MHYTWLIPENAPAQSYCRMRREPLQGHEIKWLRRALSLNQAQFAQLFGLNQATVARWENNLLRPDYLAEAALLNLWNKVNPTPSGQPRPAPGFDWESFLTGLLVGGGMAAIIIEAVRPTPPTPPKKQKGGKKP